MRLTVTLQEVCEIFRQNGIHKTKKVLADEIEKGIYPFGRVTNSGTRRSFEIYRSDVMRFIEGKR